MTTATPPPAENNIGAAASAVGGQRETAGVTVEALAEPHMLDDPRVQRAIRSSQLDRYAALFATSESTADRLAAALGHPDPDPLAPRPPVAGKRKATRAERRTSRHSDSRPATGIEGTARERFTSAPKGGARKAPAATGLVRPGRQHLVGFSLAVLALTGGALVAQGPLLEGAASQTIQTGTTISAPTDPGPASTPTRSAAEDPAQVLLDLAGTDLTGMNTRELAEHAAALQSAFAVAVVAYEKADRAAQEARGEAEVAEADAEAAEKARKAAAREVAATLASNYVRGPESDALLAALVDGPESIADFATDVQTIETFTDGQIVEVDDLDRLVAAADIARDRAEAARRAADLAATDAEEILDAVQSAAASASATATKSLLGKTNDFGVLIDPEQQARNEAALARWRDYLDAMARAGVVPPSATDLNRAEVPFGMSAVKSATGGKVPGVAKVRHRSETIVVLPQETITAVSKAFTLLGYPYLAPADPAGSAAAAPEPADAEATGVSCAGLIAQAFDGTGLGLPASVTEQYAATRSIDLANLQVGDLVFFDDPTIPGTVQHVGINLGGDLMLAANAPQHQVGVFDFPSTPFGAARATLPGAGPTAAASTGLIPSADTGSDVAHAQCGGLPAVTTLAGMQMPIADGNFDGFSAEYGEPGSMWSSGYHTGLDFAADTGTPVMAAKGGTVSLAKKSWAGTLVTIDHGEGLSTTYAHMSQIFVKNGQTVRIGDLIGAVGAEGNVTGPHLHFEVHVNGTPVDPMPYVLGGSGPQGWGGYTNGMIPASALCSPTAAPGHLLRCDAASAFDAMARAYAAALGQDLCITDSYRSYALQVQTFAKKPNLAAVPGTSNHGWGLAVDLCGGIESFTSPGHLWMKRNAPKFGFVHPEWASQTGSRPEPWHWEFGRL